ncbi:MAG TPA: hypothetical protein VML55_20380, partial [Planctomycetaceae bacterium]|nr:hypothetical protein [Planctomycetaceae bacterium]
MLTAPETPDHTARRPSRMRRCFRRAVVVLATLLFAITGWWAWQCFSQWQTSAREIEAAGGAVHVQPLETKLRRFLGDDPDPVAENESV